MTHVNIPQCVGAQVKCYNMTLRIKMISTLTSFASDLFKYNQQLPDYLHDLSSCEQCQCKNENKTDEKHWARQHQKACLDFVLIVLVPWHKHCQKNCIKPVFYATMLPADFHNMVCFSTPLLFHSDTLD